MRRDRGVLTDEPYGVAAWLASRWTERPLILKHAGSDVDRLFRVPDLATTYKEVLRSADAVLTQPALMPRFVGFGVDRSRLEADVPYSLSPAVFNPRAMPLDLRHDGTPPIIGVYGKIGISKGTFDLIAALGTLARKGIEFRLAAMIGSAQGQFIASAVQQAGIDERTDVLPMLPNWSVPSFIRACTAVCFLERDFPVAVHGPIIPREVFACGTCLVLSGEIADKQRYRDRLLSGDNVLVVDDPRDRAALAATLRSVIASPVQTAAIGGEGARLSESLEDYDAFVDGWEELLERRVRRSAPRLPGAATTSTESASYESAIPHLVDFLRGRCAPLVETFAPTATGNPFAAAVEFCDYIAARADSETFGRQLPKLVDVLAYAKARLIAANDVSPDTAVFPVCDHLRGPGVTQKSAAHLRPVKGNSALVVPFEHNVSALGILPAVGGYVPDGDHADNLAAIERGPMLVLFNRSANLIPCELRIDQTTRELLERCDGSRTAAEIVDDLCDAWGVTSAERVEQAIDDKIYGALDHLYKRAVLVFGEYREGWGWTGGARGVVPAATAAARVEVSIGQSLVQKADCEWVSGWWWQWADTRERRWPAPARRRGRSSCSRPWNTTFVVTSRWSRSRRITTRAIRADRCEWPSR